MRKFENSGHLYSLENPGKMVAASQPIDASANVTHFLETIQVQEVIGMPLDNFSEKNKESLPKNTEFEIHDFRLS